MTSLATPTHFPTIRPRWGRLAPAFLILGLALPGADAIAQEGAAGQDAEDAEIQKIGGKVERDDKAPEKPVVRVNLSITKAGDADLAHVKGLDKLKVLGLNNTPITDAGLEHLKGLSSLEKLYLVDTKVGDAGLEHLKGLANLKVLSLVGTQVTDAGLEHLKGLANLKELFVSGTKVSEDGAKKLQEALPKLKIER
jgi:Leucine-rich repeat (LRR) protein